MKKTDYFGWFMAIGTFLLSLFIIYQILRIIFGGSWSSEAVMQFIITANFTLTFAMFKTLSAHTNEIKYLRRDFDSLTREFKNHKKEFHDFKSEISKEVSDLRLEMTKQFAEINRKLDIT